MLKKSLLSLAIAAGMGLAGCSGTDSTGTTGPNGGVVPVVGGDGNTRVIYDPVTGAIPLATDLLFADASDTDGTANTDDTTPPVTTAVNDLDGWSTVSQIDIAFNDSIDPASLSTDPSSTSQNVFLIKLAADEVVQELDIQQIADLATRQTLIFKAYAATAAYLNALNNGADADTARATAQATAASSSVQIPPFAVTSALKAVVEGQLALVNTGGALEPAYASFQPVFDSLTNTGFLPGDDTSDASLQVTTPVGFQYATYHSLATGPSLYTNLVDELNVETADPEAAIGSAATLYDGEYRAEVISLDGGSNNVLRITPVTPLDPKTKYVVAVVGGTNGVQDASGSPVLASGIYEALKKDVATEPTDIIRLRAIQSLTNSLEDITAAFASTTKALSAEAAAQLESDIVVSYAFTTGGVDDVLLGMTVPNVALENAIPGVVAGVFASNFSDAVEAQYRTDNGIASEATLSVDQQSDLDVVQAKFARDVKIYPEIAISPAPVSLDAYTATLDLSGLETAPLQSLLPKPAASSDIGFWNSIEATDGTITFPEGMTQAPGKVYEGWIQIPYYGYAPDGTETSDEGVTGIRGSQWTADKVLGAALEQALTGSAPTEGEELLPPADADGTYNVTYNYPFAAKQTDETVPMVASYPGMNSLIDATHTLEEAIIASLGSGQANLADALTWYDAAVGGSSAAAVKAGVIGGDATGLVEAAVDGPYPAVIYNHGITNDRSNSLPVGNQLGAACYSQDAATGLFSLTGLPCYVTISIDQPLHGASVTLDDALAPTGSASQISGLTNVDFARVAGIPMTGAPAELRERHFGYTVTDPTTLAAGKLPNGFVASGSMFINLQNFQNSRDNLRQQILDLSTLNASLSSISTQLLAQADVQADDNGLATFDTTIGGTTITSVTNHFIGHSLGGINGLPHVASNNKSFGGALLAVGAAVQAGDVTCATAGCSRFLPNISPVRAANFAMTGGGVPKLLENSPSTSFGAPVILNGLAASGVTQGTSSYEKYMNVFQATLDSTDPVNYMENFEQSALSSATPGGLFFEIAGTWDANGTYTVNPDQTIPNDADNRPLAPLQVTGFAGAEVAPLSGTEPLLRETAVDALSGVTYPVVPTGADYHGSEGAYNDNSAFLGAATALAADAGATSDAISVASRFNDGSHGTIVSVDNATVFGDMVQQIATFFATSGRAVLVTESVLSDCDPSADAEDPKCLNN